MDAFSADKNGVSPNAISLPKGPGSIEGLGESFQPHLNTGTAKYAVGLKLPTGVAGHNPALSLDYEGGGGNGPVGYGWSIPNRYVQRRSDHGIPTYGQDVGFPRADTFINETREELVPHANGFYFHKNERAFIRYQQKGEHWEATLPNGVRLEFGVSSSGRVHEAEKVACWLLERETDTRGNVILYTYREFSGETDHHQKYLSGIQYGPGAPPWTNYHFVRFEYENRADWFEDCRWGFPVRTGQRLKTVIIGTQGPTLEGHLQGDFDGDGLPDFLNRKYELGYVSYAGENSHWSLLGSITPIGADGVSRLPSSTFGYSISNPPAEISASEQVIGSIDEPSMVMDNSLAELIDINGDALPDILKTDFTGGAHQAFINRGETNGNGVRAIRWDVPRDVDSGAGSAWNYHLDSGATHLADMDGDGLSDLVHKSGAGDVFFFRNQGRSAWGLRQDMAVDEAVPPAPFGEVDVRIGDWDFDKRADIVQSISVGNTFAYRIWFNLGNQTYSRPITIEPDRGFSFADKSVHITDWNGDRVPDVVRIQPENLTVTAGLGYGRFTSPIIVTLPEETLDETQIERTQLTDINGDGLSDLVLQRAVPGECWYWLNLGNYAVLDKKRVTGLPASIGQNAAVRWADINGNGTTDLIFADRESSPRIRAVDLGELLNNATSANLLTTISNGLGRVTSITYDSSSRFALEDAAAGLPWTNIMPHAVGVVSAFTNSDTLGHVYITMFRYHDGYYDPVEKQFRGFGRVEQVDIGDNSAPTLVTQSHFDTGRQFESMKGKLLRQEQVQEDGKVFTESTTEYQTPPRTLSTGTNNVVVRYAHPTSERTRITELGEGTERVLESEFAYDDYGNLVREADYGIVHGADRSAFNDERIISTAFAINTNTWLLRFPSRNEVQDEHGLVFSRVENYYDDETFSAGNFGQVTVGNLTMTRAWIEPGNPAKFIHSARTKYNTNGNPVLILDPLAVAPGGTIVPDRGHFREIEYDDRFHSYPVVETVHLGDGKEPLTLSAGYDEGFGVVRVAADFNQNTTQFRYDVFARLSSVIKPYDSSEFPTLEYDYRLAVEFEGGLINYIETRQLDSSPGSAGEAKRNHYLVNRTFTDGLGRAVMSRQEAEPASQGDPPRVVVTGATIFNVRQKPRALLASYFTLKSGKNLDELLDFENLESPDWRGAFHQNGGLVQLSLAEAHQTQFAYDATLRGIQKTNPDQTFSRTVFAPLIATTFDENDNDSASPFFNTPVVVHRDGLGRLVRTDEITRLNDEGIPSPTLNTWSSFYDYDVNHCLIRIKDSQGNSKTMVFDGLKRRVAMDDPNVGTTTNIYDDAGNLVERVDAKGQRITFGYDGANRILFEDYGDENSPEFSYGRTPDVAFHYDQAAGPLEQGDNTRASAANTKGMLSWVADTSGEEHNSYDARGRTEWTVKRVPDPILDPELTLNPSTLVSYRTAFQYDSFDRVTRMTYPDNDEITYLYNSRGLLATIVGGPSGNIISNIVYTPSGQQEQLEYGNGVQTSHGFDNRQRLATLTTLAPSGNTGGARVNLINFAYEFDAVSNIRQIEDRRSLADIPDGSARRNTQTYDYDDLYRLTRVRYNLPTPSAENGGEIVYRYDRIGNMLEQKSDIERSEGELPITNVGIMEAGGASGRFNRSGRLPGDPPGPHALSSIRKGDSGLRTFDYDANGNMKGIDGLKCTWDYRDRLVSLEDHRMRAEYRYDFRGRRVIKQVIPKNEAPDPAAGEAERSKIRSAVSYPSLDFEVRENDQATKFVFNGSARVAQVIGSLANAPRIQRLRFAAGWNVVSIAVATSNLLSQLHRDVPDITAYMWTSGTGYRLASTNGLIAADTILWLLSPTNMLFSAVGSYSDPVDRSVPPGRTFLPGARLEKISRPPMSDAFSLWMYAPFGVGWKLRLHANIPSDNHLPEAIPPGSALFIEAAESTTLQAPAARLRIRYYHQDHLGSSGVITDLNGGLLEEIAYFPFGGVRHEHQTPEEDVPYRYTQKERDRESNLDYFEARYLSAALSRFTSCDPKFLNLDQVSQGDLNHFLSIPAKGNVYAYALNNPLRYIDPDGLDDVDKVSTGIDVVGLGNSFLEAMDSLENNPAVKVAGKAVTVLSIGIKTTQFINNPSSDTGGQLAYEGTKTLLSVSVPPVGVLLAVLDLAGVGPSATLAALEQSIKYNRAATKSYKDAAKHWNQAATTYREGAKMIEQRLNSLRPKIEILEKEAARRNEEERRVQAKINKLEKQIKYLKRQERVYRERERKAME